MVPAVMVGDNAGKVRATCEGYDAMPLDTPLGSAHLAPALIPISLLGASVKKERDTVLDACKAAALPAIAMMLRIPPADSRATPVRSEEAIA